MTFSLSLLKLPFIIDQSIAAHFSEAIVFLTQTNKMTEGGLGRGEKAGTSPVAVTTRSQFPVAPATGNPNWSVDNA